MPWAGPHRSFLDALRSEKVQLLKDILNTMYPEEQVAEEKDTDAKDEESGHVEATSTSEACERELGVHESLGQLPSESCGSQADTMPTLPWPPCPEYPKSSLLRWKPRKKPVPPQAC